MKRFYSHYSNWEDNKAGLYLTTLNITEKEQEELTKKCIDLLSNQELFFDIGFQVLESWPISSDVNLSNPNRNRQAWLGQASCCFHLGVPEYITKYAWRMMDLYTQKEANKTADKLIKIWSEKYASKNL